MEQEHKEQWISILNDSNFPVENHEKMLEYINTHVSKEINVLEHTPVEDQKESTLPEALRTFKEIGDLSRIHFVSQPVGGYAKRIKWATTNHVIKIDYSQSDIYEIPNPEMYIRQHLIDETVSELKKLLETKDLYIYMLFSNIDTKDSIISINHRFEAK